MLIDFTLLFGAMLGMLACAIVSDFVRDLIHGTRGLVDLRFADRLLVNLLFFVLLPGMLYSWFYPLVPFSGFRAGLVWASIMFLLGAAPTLAVYRLRTPDGAGSTFGNLFWLFVKYLAVYATLGHIYQP